MAVRVTRFAENPLLSPREAAPSRPGWEVVGTFNAGAILLGEEVLLLVRVAERPPVPDQAVAAAPVFDAAGDPPEVRVLTFRRDDPDTVALDPRWFAYRGQTYLTSISHLRVARSRDGRRFVLDDHPAFAPQTWYESFGVEDPRITELEGRWVIAYSAVSAHGIATALATTQDFHSFPRHGLIFAPENRDVTIFPERIHGRYFCHHRAVARHIGGLEMWAAASPDLIHWGRHAHLMEPRPGAWDSARIGGGSVPFRTSRGWLSVYHGADQNGRYSLGALLCDPDDPTHVLARSAEPLLTPEAPYETRGFFDNVVFTCGTVVRGDELTIYYGASDQYVCGASASVADILDSLG